MNTLLYIQKSIFYTLIITLVTCPAWAGWRDAVGTAAGVGAAAAPIVLEQREEQRKATEKENARPQREVELIQKIWSNPENVKSLLGEFTRQYGEKAAKEIPEKVRYAPFVEDMEHIPLYRDEFLSGISLPFFLCTHETSSVSVERVALDSNSNVEFVARKVKAKAYPDLTFFFVANTTSDGHATGHALLGIEQTFPDGVSAKEIGERVRQKYQVPFEEGLGAKLSGRLERTPYSYSYSVRELVLKTPAVWVKMSVPDMNSFQTSKMKKEEFFNYACRLEPLINMIHAETGCTSYKELKETAETPILGALHKQFLKGLEESLTEEYNKEPPKLTFPVTLRTVDAQLTARLLANQEAKIKADKQTAQQAAQDAAAQKEAEEKAKHEASLDF